MTTADLMAAAVGGLGFILGVINTIWLVRTSRPRLRVSVSEDTSGFLTWNFPEFITLDGEVERLGAFQDMTVLLVRISLGVSQQPTTVNEIRLFCLDEKLAMPASSEIGNAYHSVYGNRISGGCLDWWDVVVRRVLSINGRNCHPKSFWLIPAHCPLLMDAAHSSMSR